MIYVPDEIKDEDEARTFFDETLEDVAAAVEVRLLKRRPEWPIETLVQQIRYLRPSG